ncbi:MAG: hypothetical protein WC823_06975 [Parcubacteria group bacterium]|jgi:hypothetical protein
MPKNISSLEEFDIMREITMPHLLTMGESLLEKKNACYAILARKTEEILLVNSPGFSTDFIFAGLSEKHIEFIAKNAPIEYKKELLKLSSSDYSVADILEIAQAMDNDLGENVTQNQQRVKNVMRYIQDNQIAFQF